MTDKPTYEELESRINALQSDVARLEQSSLTLSEKERYYRQLLANMHDDILVIDRQYRIVDVNKAFLDTSGRSRQEVVGRYCYEISHGYREPCSKYGEVCMLQQVFETGRNPDSVVEEQGLVQVSDEGAIREEVQRVLDNHPDEAAQFRAGKEKVIGFLVGQVMKATKGKANPKLVNEILRDLLAE
jgi:PAS domain-containing protein